jgi:hypothetical protein
MCPSSSTLTQQLNKLSRNLIYLAVVKQDLVDASNDLVCILNLI